MPALVTAWLGGVCLLLARLAGGSWRVRGLRRAGRALPPSIVAGRVRSPRAPARAAPRGARRRRRRSWTARWSIGWLRPVVLLPVAARRGPDAGAGGSDSRPRARARAAARRHRSTRARPWPRPLLFYHPAVWWLSSRIRAEREHCCDDIALDGERRSLRLRRGARRARELAREPPARWRWRRRAARCVARVARVLGRPPRAGADRGRHHRRAGGLSFVDRGGRAAVSRRASAGGRAEAVADTASSPRAWRMLFDHPSGQMVIRGFTARDLVRYAYQLPVVADRRRSGLARRPTPSS